MMQTMKTRKLSLRDILDIGQENISEVVPQTSQDLPWALLRKLMALDKTARNTCFVSHAQNSGSNLGTGIYSSDADNEFNPLDLLYVLLNSSDNFLKQNIYSKMAMCQFAVPLLLPDDDGSGCTFMLWAMRDIGKRWRPQSLSQSKDFLEENLVEIPMALFSFVRLGECIISKSNILNHVLSPSEQYNDFFIHKNMEGGNIERKISNGLVETSCINEQQFKLFSGCRNSLATFYFIINPSNGKNVTKETEACLEKLLLFLNIDTRNILIKDQRRIRAWRINSPITINDARFVKTLQSILKNVLDNACRKTKLENMAQIANELGINVDENCEECQKGKECATEITKKMKDVLQYKKDTMKLQGKLWKQLSQIEKELCRMREQGDLSLEEYRSQLLKQRRKHISKLQTQYKETCALAMDNREKLKKLDQQISDSSLGLEHFLREIGQFYEAECSMVREEQISKEQRQFSELPKIASTLLLDGFPLELIDEDASNIPLQWVSDVLDDLDNKTGGKCRMRVISVLGVQSTGKSTLLNTMFGLQFPVASGRCTRGGFMTLIKVKESFQDKIGCELVLVIDTEGLKAPELASLKFSNEHDNELATLVVGLSDITIINIAMENATEMKDTLQIVQTWKKRGAIRYFNDIIDYDTERDNWYIPGLWCGVPPKASVSAGYSKNIHGMKNSLFMEENSTRPAQKIGEFIEWLRSLWNAVKHENFIFSFRNSLAAAAYDQLSIKYSQWEWNFRREMYNWRISSGNTIKNQWQQNILEETSASLKDDLLTVINKEESEMLKLLEKFYEDKSDNAHLIETFHEDFMTSARSLREKLEHSAIAKMDEAVRIQKVKNNIKFIHCFDYIAQKAETGENYDEIYCQELLNTINKRLREEEVKPTPFTHLFELDIKLHILGKAAETFQDMHDKFVQSNDPMLYLGKLKPIYSTTIKHICQEKDEGHSRAEQFCEICFKPAITNHINQYLGRDIVDDILYRAGNKYCSRTFFQFTALKKLFHEENISQFVTYINSYDQFVKSWIKQNILDTYENPSNLNELQRNALSHICSDIRAVLHSEDSSTLPDFLEGFCKALGSKLIISQNEMKVVLFQNQSDVQTFSEGIESFLATIESQTLPDFQAFDVTSLLSQVTLDPQDELFKKVFGCGKQCPFCKVPCEAGGTDHKKHFASVHCPQGLNRWRHSENRKLTVDICSTAVSSDHTFRNPVTDWKWHPYKQYRTIYPDWDIKPDPSITASDYWKYIFAKFNTKFAEEYNALPADLPDSWNDITEDQALNSLEEVYAMKKY
ncbi:hypothetical protein XELAEV_18001544mg [Xenopus laevis]|nr:hypothetical protein XELAEV_18001544mg [Xenopus laevis]